MELFLFIRYNSLISLRISLSFSCQPVSNFLFRYFIIMWVLIVPKWGVLQLRCRLTESILSNQFTIVFIPLIRRLSISSSNTSSNLHDAIYAQHELDIKTITKLNNRIKELEKENGEFESKIHYLRLDVVNTICERNELQKEVKTLYIENDKNIKQAVIILDNDKKNKFYFDILKIIVIILLILNIYFPAVKYFLMFFSVGLLVI